jgi:hypothetical protein
VKTLKGMEGWLAARGVVSEGDGSSIEVQREVSRTRENATCFPFFTLIQPSTGRLDRVYRLALRPTLKAHATCRAEEIGPISPN